MQVQDATKRVLGEDLSGRDSSCVCACLQASWSSSQAADSKAGGKQIAGVRLTCVASLSAGSRVPGAQVKPASGSGRGDARPARWWSAARALNWPTFCAGYCADSHCWLIVVRAIVSSLSLPCLKCSSTFPIFDLVRRSASIGEHNWHDNCESWKNFSH